MTKFRFVILFSFFATHALTNAQTAPGVAPDVLNDPTWEFVWGDEFDGSALDLTKWNTLNEDDRGTGQNLVFLENNVTVGGGNLVVSYKKETYSCSTLTNNCSRQDELGVPYDNTGGFVRSTGGANAPFVQYGYIEASIRLHYGFGLLPAFWTFRAAPFSSGINACEIDIFEMPMDLPGTDVMTSNVHYTYNDKDTPQDEHTPPFNPIIDNYDGFEKTFLSDFSIGPYDNVYRVFSVEWNPTQIIWYVDGIEIRRYPRQVGDPAHEIQNAVKIIFDMGLNANPDSTTPSLVTMEVAYLRIYKQQGDCTVLNSPVFYFGGYQNTVKESITLSGSGNTNIQPVGTSLYLVATDFVQLNGAFEVPLGSELVINIANSCYIE